MDAVEHTTNTDHPLTSAYAGEDKPRSGSGQIPTDLQHDGREEQRGAHRAEQQGQKRARKLQLWPHKGLAQSPSIQEEKMLLDLVLELPHGSPTGAGPGEQIW